jgi:bacterioferritin-associated ferredoxin
MNPLPVDRCVCFNLRFAEMQRHLLSQKRGGCADDTAMLDGLRATFGCGSGCAMCVPYIRAMLKTGRTAFAVDDPALRDPAV